MGGVLRNVAAAVVFGIFPKTVAGLRAVMASTSAANHGSSFRNGMTVFLLASSLSAGVRVHYCGRPPGRGLVIGTTMEFMKRA